MPRGGLCLRQGTNQARRGVQTLGPTREWAWPLILERASGSGRVPRSVGGARGLGGANGVSGGAGCGRYCRRRGPRDGRSPGRWCWWPPPLPEPEPEPPPLPPRVVASQGGGMLGKGGVGGGGGTKAPKPSFVSYVRPEVRVRRASAAAGGTAGTGALPARVPGGAKRQDALGPLGWPRPGPLRQAGQVLGQGPVVHHGACGQEPESGRSCGPSALGIREGSRKLGWLKAPRGVSRQPAAWCVCSALDFLLESLELVCRGWCTAFRPRCCRECGSALASFGVCPEHPPHASSHFISPLPICDFSQEVHSLGKYLLSSYYVPGTILEFL